MVKRSDDQWQALFAEQAGSGLSAAAFCKERKLCPKYFSLRRKQLAAQGVTKQPPRFIQAKPAVVSAGPQVVRLCYGNIELVFDTQDVGTITAVAKALA